MAGVYKTRHRDFLLKTIPVLDASYLKNFYEEQEKRIEKDRRTSDSKAKRTRRK